MFSSSSWLIGQHASYQSCLALMTFSFFFLIRQVGILKNMSLNYICIEKKSLLVRQLDRPWLSWISFDSFQTSSGPACLSLCVHLVFFTCFNHKQHKFHRTVNAKKLHWLIFLIWHFVSWRKVNVAMRWNMNFKFNLHFFLHFVELYDMWSDNQRMIA